MIIAPYFFNPFKLKRVDKASNDELISGRLNHIIHGIGIFLLIWLTYLRIPLSPHTFKEYLTLYGFISAIAVFIYNLCCIYFILRKIKQNKNTN